MLQAALDLDLRRAATAGAVLLLHLLLLAGFFFSNLARPHQPGTGREIELFIPRVLHHAVPLPAPPLRPNLIRPAMPEIIVPPAPQGTPGVSAAPPAPGSLQGVGRALFGCDPAKLDTLSPEARAGCLRSYAGKPHEQSVRLGPPPDPNSPFTKEIEERFREARPINRPCPPGSHNDTLGLPCFGFDQKSPLLPGQ
ncbi:MAG TPA: hypothetical protein VHY79_07035 [Rhizomicrobium sp.]|nr:hypothetical protein [Rhizomicrobium sp.]